MAGEDLWADVVLFSQYILEHSFLEWPVPWGLHGEQMGNTQWRKPGGRGTGMVTLSGDVWPWKIFAVMAKLYTMCVSLL